MEGKYLSARNAASLLGIKTRTVREWIRKGKLVGTRYGTSNRWYVSEVEVKRLRGGDAN